MGGWGSTGCHRSELVLSTGPRGVHLAPSSGQRRLGKGETGTGGGGGHLEPWDDGEALAATGWSLSLAQVPVEFIWPPAVDKGDLGFGELETGTG